MIETNVLSALEAKLKTELGYRDFDWRRLDTRDSALSQVTFLTYRDTEGRPARAVLRSIAQGPFGFEYPEDSLRHLYESYRAGDKIAGHARPMAFGVIGDGTCHIIPRENATFFMLEEHLDGTLYGPAFEQLRGSVSPSRRATEVGIARDLARHLAAAHTAEQNTDRNAYRRALRDIVGAGEGVLGLIDGYPDGATATVTTLRLELQIACLRAIQPHKHRCHRLRRTHGDFHPWNIIWGDDGQWRTIDQSRLEWNDPAVDVGALLINYIAIGLYETDFTRSLGFDLARIFLTTYLDATNDREILEVLPVFTAARCAAVVSPCFYPETPDALHNTLFEGCILMCSLARFDETLTCLPPLFSAAAPSHRPEPGARHDP